MFLIYKTLCLFVVRKNTQRTDVIALFCVSEVTDDRERKCFTIRNIKQQDNCIKLGVTDTEGTNEAKFHNCGLIGCKCDDADNGLPLYPAHSPFKRDNVNYNFVRPDDLVLLHKLATFDHDQNSNTNNSFMYGQNFDKNIIIIEILTHLSQLMNDGGTAHEQRYESFFQTITERIRQMGIEKKLDQYPDSVGDMHKYTPWFKCHLIIQRFRVRLIFFSPRLQVIIKETILLGNLKYDALTLTLTLKEYDSSSVHTTNSHQYIIFPYSDEKITEMGKNNEYTNENDTPLAICNGVQGYVTIIIAFLFGHTYQYIWFLFFSFFLSHLIFILIDLDVQSMLRKNMIMYYMQMTD